MTQKARALAHTHAHLKQRFCKMLLLMHYTLIFLFYFILKILIAVTDCTTVLSSIHISLYNLPSHIIVAFHLEDGMVIALCRAAWSVLQGCLVSPGSAGLQSRAAPSRWSRSPRDGQGTGCEEMESFYGGKGREKIKSESLAVSGRKQLRDHWMPGAAKTTTMLVPRLDRCAVTRVLRSKIAKT